MVPVLAGISLVLFTILALAPGDPFEELAANPNVPREVAQALRHQYGLDDPVAVRYVRWRSEEHTSELQSPCNLVCRLLLEKKKKKKQVHSLAAPIRVRLCAPRRSRRPLT